MIVASGPSFHDMLVMLDRVPEVGTLTDSRQTLVLPGGGAAATAAWASRLGEPAAVVTCAGGPDGAALRLALAEAGVAHQPLAGDTVRCLVMVTDGGERTMINLQPVPAPGQITEQAQHLLAAATICWSDWPDEQTARAVHDASPEGRRATPLRLLPRELEQGRRYEVVLGSEPDDFRPTTEQLGRCGCLLCVITDGARGGEFWTPQSGWQRFLAEPIPGEFIDSCGAGDAFAAGVLVGVARGVSGDRAVTLGAEAAAVCCCRPGSFPS